MPIPPGWSALYGPNLQVLRPPDGGGEVRVHERFAPLLRFSAVCQRVAGAAARPAEVLLTVEGEHAAWAAPGGRFVGVIFGDDFVALIDGRPPIGAGDEARAEFGRLCRRLLCGTRLGLGRRRRRYLYEGPAGWLALPSGLVANWYPADYPTHRGVLVVYPATPIQGEGEEAVNGLLLEEQRRGLVLSERSGPEPIASDSGLSGGVWELRGSLPRQKEWRSAMVMLADEGYLYGLRLDSGTPARAAEHGDILRRVVRSIQPVPRPAEGAAQPGTAQTMDHWAT